MKGYVYAIVDWDDKIRMPTVIKFGFTSDKKIENRIRSLQTGNPRKLTAAKMVELDSEEIARSYERLIHSQFKTKKLHGEWFAYDLDIEEFLDFHFQAFGETVIHEEMGLIRMETTFAFNPMRVEVSLG